MFEASEKLDLPKPAFGMEQPDDYGLDLGRFGQRPHARRKPTGLGTNMCPDTSLGTSAQWAKCAPGLVKALSTMLKHHFTQVHGVVKPTNWLLYPPTLLGMFSMDTFHFVGTARFACKGQLRSDLTVKFYTPIPGRCLWIFQVLSRYQRMSFVKYVTC